MNASLALFFVCLAAAAANNTDRFNYRGTEGRDFGPQEWNRVKCDDERECLGWPDGWELAVGWELRRNECEWCPAEGGNNCGIHRQSPIDLLRSPSTTGHDTECYDYHWMAYQDGSCEWHDIVKNGYSKDSNNFKIRRHALQIHQPVDEAGELQCDGETGRRFPRLDYSKGFPDWWFLSHTEIVVPSEHTQEGKQYDAEVHLEHFYSVDHDRKMGIVTIFLEADPNRERWDFLDKLICQWREVEEQTRDECGLESVPPYPGCRNPDRKSGETSLPHVDPYPFIDCDSVENSARICKASSCCETERSTSRYCQDEVYERYGDETVGSICWWCCPGKLLGPSEGALTAAPTPHPTTAPTPFKQTFYPTPLYQETPIASPSPLPISPEPSTTAPHPVTTAKPTVPYPAVPVVCSDFSGHPDINIHRICKDGGCCDDVRSASDDCHFAYKFFGVSMASVCSECCEPSKQLAPKPLPHPIYPPIDCTLVVNPFRICKPTSCCNEVASTSSYCQAVYESYGDMMGSVCWYCCEEPKEVDPSVLPLTLPYAPVPVPTAAPGIVSPVTPTPTVASGLKKTFSPTISNPPSSDFDGTTSFPVSSDETFSCDDYRGIPEANFNRICSDEVSGCCNSKRSATTFCHKAYNLFGKKMELACSKCCDPPKQVAPPPNPHPIYPPTDCSIPVNPHRICRSCCNPLMSTTSYCRDTYANYAKTIGSICWYCCSDPMEVDTTVLDVAGSTSASGQFRMLNSVENQENESLQLVEDFERTDNLHLPHGLWLSDLVLDPANFEVTENLEVEYVASIEEYRRRQDKKIRGKRNRQLEITNSDNYVDVPYSPYEWMREVRTEYYYRYEGTQMVPPCFDTVHYRVMKDPILINPLQLKELERLLAWRIAPKDSEFNSCKLDTAGRERPGSNGDAVDLNRPLQSYNNIHRKVFCECKDWDSKWQEDRDWCELDKNVRFFEHPYNFDWNGPF